MKFLILIFSLLIFNLDAQMNMEGDDPRSQPKSSKNAGTIVLEEPVKPKNTNSSSMSMEDNSPSPYKNQQNNTIPNNISELTLSNKRYTLVDDGDINFKTSKPAPRPDNTVVNSLPNPRKQTVKDVEKISRPNINIEVPDPPMEDLSKYPNLLGNTKRAILLHKLADEDQYKIEFHAYVIETIDQCNKYKLSGYFDRKELKGWGNSYYIFHNSNVEALSNLDCGVTTKSEKKIFCFASMIENYNSSNPIVIYTAPNVNISYRIFRTDGVERDAQIIK